MGAETQTGKEVIYLAKYRRKPPPEIPNTRSDEDKLLDEISYHILMAARAIARKSNP